jgi:hypothetical protein
MMLRRQSVGFTVREGGRVSALVPEYVGRLALSW